jgi:hypothetical protein
MKIGLVGPTYQESSLPFDAQRLVNMYPVMDEQGKEVSALYGTPGLEAFATTNLGPGRKTFKAANGRAFVVSGAALYEVLEDGTTTSRGALEQTSGNVTIAENPLQLAVCDGVNIFILTYSSNAFAKVTDADRPNPCATITFIDGYFIGVEGGSGRFFISSPNDGTAWDALDFATAESNPDELVGAFAASGQLWLGGKTNTEMWTNTGASDFPFRRISGGVMNVGFLSPYSAMTVGGMMVWLGRDEYGKGIVYTAAGFTPERISTSPIERLIQEADDAENIRAWAYQKEGHLFYVLTGGGLETSLAYDFSTQQWHERAYLNEYGDFEQHLAIDCMFAFGKHLVLDRRNGNVYDMRNDVYSDNGDAIAAERIFTHLSDEDKRVRYNRLVVGVEAGVGLQSGQGSDPVISMRLSKDGAKTWSDWHDADIGAAGEYKNKSVWRRLGIAEQMTFAVRITDPVKRAITGAYLT